jgi:hypothetical protein
MINFLSLVPVFAYMFRNDIESKMKEYINILILMLFIYTTRENHKESLYLLISLVIFNFSRNGLQPVQQEPEEISQTQELPQELPKTQVILKKEEEVKEEEEVEEVKFEEATRNDEENQNPLLYGYNINQDLYRL